VRADGRADARKSAAIFRRTRDAHRAEAAEDYVEAIAELIRVEGEARVMLLARVMGVSHVTVSRTLKRLTERGLVLSERHRPVTLTEAGQSLALRARERHDVVLAFLESLGVPREQALLDAEGIEHHVSEETIAGMKRRLAGGEGEA
jgi:DtxR family manganese transport transcriptional regulator